MDEDILKHLNDLQPYFEAFFKSTLRQKQVANHCNIRPSTFSDLVRYFKGQTKYDPETFDHKTGALLSVLKNFQKSGDIVNNVLVLVGESAQKKVAQKGLIETHPNYSSAGVSLSLQNAGEEVCLLNTYLATKLFNTEDSENDPDTLINWIKKQKKKVRLLLLRPDGKAMRLRTKTDLGYNITNLTSHIISGLEMALQLKGQYPDQLDIRLMDELPALTCVILDNKLFYGLHYATGHAESGPYFEVKDSRHYTYQKIKDHFETLWSGGRSQELDEDLLTQVKNAVQVVNNQLDYLLGQWDVFLHNLSLVYKGEEAAPDKVLSAGLERFHLNISKNDRDIYPAATLTLPGPEVLTGSLVTEGLQGCEYAHIRFTDHVRLSIHITIQCKRENKTAPLYGFFTLSSGSDSCTGVLVLNKKEQNLSLSADHISEAWKRQLGFCNGSFISLQNVRNNIAAFHEPFPYAGVYKVYSYGGNANESKNIKINWLRINEWGEAQYKNQHFNEKEKSGILHGRATEIHRNTHIVFTGFRDEKRRSYLIIHTNLFRSIPGRYYSAVHLGVSWDNHMPNGKRFLLERSEESFDQVEPKLVPLHTEEYRNLPTAIRKLLTGRVKNLLGFLRLGSEIFSLRDMEREANLSIKMEEIFQDSAIMLARRARKTGDLETIKDMLFRAVNHGLDTLDTFENELRELAPEVLEQLQATSDYKKIQEILRRKDTTENKKDHPEIQDDPIDPII